MEIIQVGKWMTAAVIDPVSVRSKEGWARVAHKGVIAISHVTQTKRTHFSLFSGTAGFNVETNGHDPVDTSPVAMR